MENNPYSGSQSDTGGLNLHFDLSGIISFPAFFSRKAGQPLRPSDWKLWFSAFFYLWKFPNETVQPYYTAADGWHWKTTKADMLSLSFTIEGALLIPIGGIHLQLGGGRIFNSAYLDSNPAGSEGVNFINISGRMLKF